MEVIIPTEIGMPTLRTDIPEQSNTKSVIKDLDMAGKLHEAMAVLIASYQQTRETLNVPAKGPGPEKSFREHSRSVKSSNQTRRDRIS